MNRGEGVRHPKRSDWGMGEVLEVLGSKAVISFENAGVKTIDTNLVTLELVPNAAPVPMKVDMQRLEALCQRFYAEMEHNRKHYNDGVMAVAVLTDMKRRGQLTETNRKRLLNWCYTDGTVFQAGVGLAREICTMIYGTIPKDPDQGV